MFAEFGDAVRSLRSKPLTAVGAAMSLGLGMALATSVFGVLDGLVSREPFRGAASVLQLRELLPGRSQDVAAAPARHLLAMRAEHSFLKVAGATDIRPVSLGRSGEAASYPAVTVTTGYFETLGIQPWLGRSFLEGDGDASEARAIVLSYSLWHSRFGGRPDVLNSRTLLDGHAAIIVGIMPNGFDYPATAKLWTLIQNSDLRSTAAKPEADWPRFKVVARLLGTTNLAAAESQLRLIINNADAVANVRMSPRIRLISLPNAIRHDRRAQMEVWVALSFIVLLLCAVNFATVSLARGISRRAEIAVRCAIGASPWRIARMLMCEAVLVAVGAGIIAVLLSIWFTGLVQLSLPQAIRIAVSDNGWRTLAFGTLGTLVVGLLFGGIPAIQVSRSDLRSELSAHGSSGRDFSGLSRSRTTLVALELGLAVLCVVSAVAVMRADRRFRGQGPGYDYRQVVTGRLLVPDSAARATMGAPLLDFIRRQPGVLAASLVHAPVGLKGAVGVSTELRPTPVVGMIWLDVSFDFFSTLGVHPLSGRLPNRSEVGPHSQFVVLPKSASTVFERGDAVGRRIKIKIPRQEPFWATVIAVIPDIGPGPYFSILDGDAIYTVRDLPLDKADTRLFVRVGTDAGAGLPSLTRAFTNFDSRVVVADLRPVSTDVARFEDQERGRSTFLAGITALSVVLAAIGVYSLSLFITASRVKELCLRVALGAGAWSVSKIMLRDLMAKAMIGSAVGILAASRVAQLLDVALRRPEDGILPVVAFSPLAGAVVASILLVVTLAAAYLPIRGVLRGDIGRELS